MTEMERNALEREFEDKSGRLTEMMIQMSDMQTAYKKYEAAARANAVMVAYEAMTAENDEVERMQKHVSRAEEQSKNAKTSGTKEFASAAKEAAKAQQLALELALKKQAEAKTAYEAALHENGFDSEEAFKAAFLTKPAFMKLDETINPFRMEYATLLARCEEIEALLSAEEA